MILIKFLLAHLLGDFIAQPHSWVRQKREKKWGSPQLYFHAGIHFLLVVLVLWNLSEWYIAAIIAGTHLLIDGFKLSFQNTKNKRLLFFVDQALHISVLLLVWIYFFPPEFQFQLSPTFFIYLTGAIFLTQPSSIFIKTLISVYKPQTKIQDNESLRHAGNYIGILERLLVFLFILTHHWEGVGFLIAAKSIFRFNDLSKAKNRKLTEYMLIGTLLSFGIAIVTGVLISF